MIRVLLGIITVIIQTALDPNVYIPICLVSSFAVLALVFGWAFAETAAGLRKR